MRGATQSLLLALLVSCGGGGGGGAPALPGDWVWQGLDGSPPPVVFPLGTGTTLLSGALELTPIDSTGSGRFRMSFTLRPGSSDSTIASGEAGTYRLAADTLHFTPGGGEDRSPVSFRHAWAPDGTLELTDAQGHVWRYVRQAAPPGN